MGLSRIETWCGRRLGCSKPGALRDCDTWMAASTATQRTQPVRMNVITADSTTKDGTKEDAINHHGMAEMRPEMSRRSGPVGTK